MKPKLDGDFVLEDYQNNPFIECLPPIRSYGQVYNSLLKDCVFSEKERAFPPEMKFHLLQRLNQFFQPLGQTLDLNNRISILMRMGYVERNPLDKTEYSRLFNKTIDQGAVFSYSHSFSLLGIPGMGKSRSIELILSYYPRVIFHPSPINRYQIPWLKINCPHDGSLKTLCLMFFKEIDDLLGTDYLKKFGSARFSTSAMVMNMAHLAKIHAIGILVIDEIQHLISSRGSGNEQMMNFFVTLTNSVGIPILLVGTMKARSVLQKDFRQARRSCGIGDIVWENFKTEDDDWNLFIESLWKNQLTLNVSKLTKRHLHVIYNETQGVIDIVLKLFFLSQLRAIEVGAEEITPELMQQVANEDLKMIKPMIHALRTQNKKELLQFDDIVPLNFDLKIEKTRIEVENEEQKVKKMKRSTLYQDAYNLLKQMNISSNKLDIILRRVLEDIIKRVLDELEPNNQKSTLFKNEIMENVLRKIEQGVREEDIHHYLVKVGFIKKVEMGNERGEGIDNDLSTSGKW